MSKRNSSIQGLCEFGLDLVYELHIFIVKGEDPSFVIHIDSYFFGFNAMDAGFTIVVANSIVTIVVRIA